MRYRIVRHFQFTSWPDHGVPDGPISAVDFVKTVRCYIESIHGPVIIHCRLDIPMYMYACVAIHTFRGS